ncbi:MAG: quinone-interacting membrane-bound oxidoreductase complex subunit QmoC [Nitrospiraceae bacterium]|nr:quinone-interacting membrane-bound oxidoreductase complex subunit QmoC [Nitrospiraceae bacterium]
MSERILNPDLGFVKDVINAGGESLKKCYQCATCSVVCNVSPDDSPFPRKEMVQAQWGLKDELFRNPDIWLCHQCSDCTANCPRGAKPGEVLNAIRKMSIEEFSVSRFMARMVNQPVFLLLLFAVPVAILLAFVAGQGFLGGNIPLQDGKIEYGKFLFSLKYIDPLFSIVALLALASLGIGISKYWKAMYSGLPAGSTPKMGLGAAITDTIKDILAHNRFKKCEVTKARSTAHMLVFYSFIGLFITTILAFGKVILEPQTGYLAYLGHPVEISESLLTGLIIVYKIIGNISAVALIAGILLVMANRMNNAKKAGLGSYYDWLFISIVAGLGITGLLAELLRLANTPVAYPIYIVHLSFVFFLFAYAPFSKMAHMFYRGTAMVFGKMTGRI